MRPGIVVRIDQISERARRQDNKLMAAAAAGPIDEVLVVVVVPCRVVLEWNAMAGGVNNATARRILRFGERPNVVPFLFCLPVSHVMQQKEKEEEDRGGGQ